MMTGSPKFLLLLIVLFLNNSFSNAIAITKESTRESTLRNTLVRPSMISLEEEDAIPNPSATKSYSYNRQSNEYDSSRNYSPEYDYTYSKEQYKNPIVEISNSTNNRLKLQASKQIIDKISSRNDEITRFWRFETDNNKNDDADDDTSSGNNNRRSGSDTLNSSEIKYYEDLSRKSDEDESDLLLPSPTILHPTTIYGPPNYDHSEHFQEQQPVADDRILVKHSHRSHQVIHLPVYTPLYRKQKVITHVFGPPPPRHNRRKPLPPLPRKRRPGKKFRVRPKRPPPHPRIIPKHGRHHHQPPPPHAQHKAYAPAFISYGPIATHNVGGGWQGHSYGGGDGRYQHSIQAPRYIPPALNPIKIVPPPSAPPLPPGVGRVVANYLPPGSPTYIPPPVPSNYLPPSPTFGPPMRDFSPAQSYWKDISPATIRPNYGPPPFQDEYNDGFGFNGFNSPPTALYGTPNKPPSMIYVPTSSAPPPMAHFGHPMQNYGPPLSSYGPPENDFDTYQNNDVSASPQKPRYKNRRRKNKNGRNRETYAKPNVQDDGIDHGYYDKVEEQLHKKIRPPSKSFAPRRPPPSYKNNNYRQQVGRGEHFEEDHGPVPAEEDEHYDYQYDEDNYNDYSSPFQQQQQRPKGKQRPAPSFNTNYNSPGLYLDPKIIDWTPYTSPDHADEEQQLQNGGGGRRYRYKRNRKQKSDLTGTSPIITNERSSNEATGVPNSFSSLTKYTTLPDSLENHKPNPDHVKYPKLTYDASTIVSTKKAPPTMTTTTTRKATTAASASVSSSVGRSRSLVNRRRRPFMNPTIKKLVNLMSTTNSSSSSSFSLPSFADLSAKRTAKASSPYSSSTSLAPTSVINSSSSSSIESSTNSSPLLLPSTARLISSNNDNNPNQLFSSSSSSLEAKTEQNMNSFNAFLHNPSNFDLF